MSGLDNLKKRIGYYGTTTEDRMRNDKTRTLKKALFNSYQAETIILSDGREFKCLINRDKLEKDYDDRTISIPFKDICLNAEKKGKTSESQQETNIKPGDILQWKENGTYWILYLPKLEESAYLRATIRRCRYELTINNNVYKIYFRGPTTTQAAWRNQGSAQWNSMNYDAMLTITRNEETLEFFDRFVKVKIGGKNWKVAATDKFSTEGIIDVYLEEDFSNTIEEENPIKPAEPPQIEEGAAAITGSYEVYPYDIKVYLVENIEGGYWEISNEKKAKFISQDEVQAKIEITGNKGTFDIIYKKDGQNDIIYPVKILSI